MFDSSTPLATVVPDAQRLAFLPSLFGARSMMRGEALVYRWMECLNADYDGGYWHFYAASNGAQFMAPRCAERIRLAVDGNGFDGELSPDVAGIVVTLFALCELAALTRDDLGIAKYYALRDFALTHVEAGAIFAAID